MAGMTIIWSDLLVSDKGIGLCIKGCSVLSLFMDVTLCHVSQNLFANT